MTDSPRAPQPHATRWRRITGSAWFHLGLALVLTSLVLTFVAKPYWVPSGSMEETLEPGDRVLVNRLAYVGAEPSTGDVIVFDADETWGQTSTPANFFVSAARWLGEVTGFGPSGSHTLVKRVIGESGQTVECCSPDGAVVVDGEPLDEPYVTNDFAFTPGVLDCATEPRSSRCFNELIVPDDKLLVLGDNRAGSSDSVANCRVAQPVEQCARWATRDGVVGKAAVILWPIARWGGI